MPRLLGILCGALRRAGLCALALWLALSAPVTAAPQDMMEALRQRLADMEAALASDDLLRGLPVQDVLARYGLESLPGQLAPDVARRPAIKPHRHGAPEQPATAEIADFRIVLALLSQSYDNEDNNDVIAAQGARGATAIAFRGGVVTADLIRRAIADLDPAAQIGTGPGPMVLPRAVLLWEDTVLRLGPEDDIALSRPDGAFILSLGAVEVEGSKLGVAGGPNPHTAEFVPFLTVGGGGSLRMHGATVKDLGFGWTDKFTGVSLVGHPFIPSQGTSAVTDSRFENIVTLLMAGAREAQITGNRFYNMRDNALRVMQAPRARIEENLFYGAQRTNGIRLLDRSAEAVIAGNVFLGGERAGILVRDGSSYTKVTGNLIWGRNGGAIKFDRVSCSVASHNLVIDGKQKGIEIRRSPGTQLTANLIGENHSTGIWISEQPEGALTRIEHNVLVRNGSGITTATAGHIELFGNDLTRQLPRLVKGDIVMQNRALITDLRGQYPLILAAGQSAPLGERLAGQCETEVRP